GGPPDEAPSTDPADPAEPGDPARQARPEAVPPQAAGKAERVRDPFFDNARILALVLVVAGHAWQAMRGYRPVDAAQMFVYAFHLPVFVLIAGHLGRGFTRSTAKVRGIVTTLAVPYLLFDAAYGLFGTLAGGRRFSWSPLQPYYLTWFLLAL